MIVFVKEERSGGTVDGQTKLLVWIFGGQSTVLPLP